MINERAAEQIIKKNNNKNKQKITKRNKNLQ